MAGAVAMYCRLQGYLSPLLVVLIRYQASRPNAREVVPVLLVVQEGLCWWREWVMLPLSLKFAMVFLTSTNHGCVYTLSQENGDELFYAPIYTNGNINLEEFAPVDINEIDMDEMEVYDIMRRLKLMNEV